MTYRSIKFGAAVFTAGIAFTAVLASPAVSLAATKDQAFAKAKVCLISKHVARLVIRRPDGGGFASLMSKRGGSAFWTYKTVLRQVASTTVRYGGVPGPSSATKQRVEACLKAAQ